MKMKKEKNNQKPLTLEALVSYNQEVMFPWTQKQFTTKTEFKDLNTDFHGLKTEFKDLNTDFHGLKTEFKDFKNESLTNQDAMLKKLDILLTEKTVREHQEKKGKEIVCDYH